MQFSIPQTDIFPDSGQLPPPLVLGEGQFALHATVRLSLLCRRRQGDEREGSVIRTSLQVAALGRFVRRGGAGSDTVSVDLLQVEIVHIAPESLESMIECVMLILLSAALRTFEVSVEKLPVAAVGVTITVARGPEAETISSSCTAPSYSRKVVTRYARPDHGDR